MNPFVWMKDKVADHPGAVVGGIVGTIIGLPLGPAALAMTAAGVAIGNTLDQPRPKGKDD